MSLLLGFVSLLLVNIKEKQQYLVSFYKLPVLKGRAQTSLWPKKSEPGGPFGLWGLRVLRTVLQAPWRALLNTVRTLLPGGVAGELGGSSPGLWLHPADPGCLNKHFTLDLQGPLPWQYPLLPKSGNCSTSPRSQHIYLYLPPPRPSSSESQDSDPT